MRRQCGAFIPGTLALVLGLGAAGAAAQDPAVPKGGGYGAEAGPHYDSYKYYGPNGLWKVWTPAQKHGRDTWILWTGGNQKFLRWASEYGSSLPVPVSIEMYRALDSRHRATRFQQFGLVVSSNVAARGDHEQAAQRHDDGSLHQLPINRSGREPILGGDDECNG